MFELQKDIPIPSRAHSPRPRARKYPFDTMDIGEMFFVPNKTKNTMSTHASNVSKQLGRRFATRLITMRNHKGKWLPCAPADKDAVTGIGVWREA